MIRCESLAKVYSSSIGTARSRAFRDILFRRRRRAGVLRAGEFYALKDLSFTLGAGEKLLVLGTPGSGKTTLAKVLAGILRPDEGRVAVEGSVLSVFQRKLGHFPLTRLKEYLTLAPLLFQCSSRGKRVGGAIGSMAALIEFCELEPWMKASVRDVPKEILNRISFCAPLFIEADCYLFDGPWATGTGPFLKKCQAKVLEVIASRGVVMVAGSPKDLPPVFQSALVLHQGREAWRGPLAEAGRVFNELQRAPRGADVAALIAARSTPPPAAVHGLPPGPLAPAIPKGPPDPSTALLRDVDRLDAAGKLVVAGPWLGEIGLEILYWLPFLSFLRKRFGWSRERLGAVSSNGLHPAYHPLCERQVDVLDIFQGEALEAWSRRRVRETGSAKQYQVTPFERELAALSAELLGFPQFEVLHPSLLFRALTQAWSRAIPLENIQAFLAPLPFRIAAGGRPPSLPPPPFIAVSLEHTAFFPDNPRNRSIGDELLRELAHHGELVVLDHAEDRPSMDAGRIRRLRDVAGGPVGAGAVRKLQLEVMERAAAVVGSWGIPLLGPALGARTFLLHDGEPGTLPLHLEVARRSALEMDNGGALTTIDTAGNGVAGIIEMVGRMPADRGPAPAATRPLGERR